MGVPWNPEWDEQIRQVAEQVARQSIDTAFSDGTSLSQFTPGSIPSIASTHRVKMLVPNTDALAVQTQLSGSTAGWQPLNPVIEMTVESGGRPVILLFNGPALSVANDECRLSFAINGAEVTNTTFGLGIFRMAEWVPMSMAWLILRPLPRFAVSVVGRRDTVAGSAQIATTVARSTLIAWEA